MRAIIAVVLAVTLGLTAWIWQSRPSDAPALVVDPPPEVVPHERLETSPSSTWAARRDVEGDAGWPVEVRGAVLDDRRRPVEGAEVRLWMPHHRETSAQTDATGRFVLPTRAPHAWAHRLGSVCVTHESSQRAAIVSCIVPSTASAWWSRNDEPVVRVGPVILGPADACAGRLDLATDLTWTRTVLVSTPRGAVPWSSSSDAAWSFDCFPTQPVTVEAWAESGAFAREWLGVAPRTESTTGLRPQPAAALRVTVRDIATGAGVQGVDVAWYDDRIMEDPNEPGRLIAASRRPLRQTDEHGCVTLPFGRPQWALIRLVPNARWAVDRVEGADVETHFAGLGVWFSAAEGPEVVVHVRRDERQRDAWSLVDGELPVPRPGTRIQLRAPSSWFRDSTATAEGVVVAGVSGLQLATPRFAHAAVDVIGSAPDGSLVRLRRKPDAARGEPASFRRPRSIRVRMLEPGGAPAVGAALFARVGPTWFSQRPVWADDDGGAELLGFHGGSVLLVAQRDAALPQVWRPSAPNVAMVEVETGDAEVTLTVGRPVDVQLTFIEEVTGERRLPTQYEVTWQASALPGAERLMAGARLARLTEDAARGEATARVWAGASERCMVQVQARGWQTVREEVDTGGHDVVAMDVMLRRAPSIRLGVRPPTDGQYNVQLQQFNERSQTWQVVAPPWDGFERPIIERVQEIDGLVPGTYRALDRFSGTRSKTIQLGRHDRSLPLSLDLSQVGVVSGHVEHPPASDLQRAFVVAEAEGADQQVRHQVRHQVGSDGAFSMRLSGETRYALRVDHPTLACTRAATVRAPQGSVVLAVGVERGVSFRLGRCPTEAPAELTLWAGVDGTWTRHRVALEDGRSVWSAPAPRLSLVFDLLGAAPLRFDHLDTEEGVDLGDLHFDVGTTLRVAPHVEFEGSCAIFVERSEPPRIQRTYSGRIGDALVPGLASGDHHVTIRLGTTTRTTLTFDGRTDHVWSPDDAPSP